MRFFHYHLFIALLFTSFKPLEAAAPVTHLYFAEKWLEKFPLQNEDNVYAFLAGNLFPDVRYVSGTPRNETHEKAVSLQDVYLAPTPFVAGVRLHCFVDDLREKVVRKHKAYASVSDIAKQDGKSAYLLLKLIEDELLYDKIDTALATNALKELKEEEITSGIALESIKKWHFFLSAYLKLKPSQMIPLVALSRQSIFGVSTEHIQGWNESFTPLLEKLRPYADHLLEEFKKAFDEFKAPHALLEASIQDISS